MTVKDSALYSLYIFSQLEILDNFAPKKDEVKSLSMKVIMTVNDRIPQLQGEENLLRLYQIVVSLNGNKLTNSAFPLFTTK